jgi:hypothetical protein
VGEVPVEDEEDVDDDRRTIDNHPITPRVVSSMEKLESLSMLESSYFGRYVLLSYPVEREREWRQMEDQSSE